MIILLEIAHKSHRHAIKKHYLAIKLEMRLKIKPNGNIFKFIPFSTDEIVSILILMSFLTLLKTLFSRIGNEEKKLTKKRDK